MSLTAIETRYAGCRFRSRLEARWAVFFSTLGIPWQYEPQGFDLPIGRYLPDFLLWDQIWFEVKGAFDGRDIVPTAQLAKHSKLAGVIAFGDIPRDGDEGNGMVLIEADGTGCSRARWVIGNGKIGVADPFALKDFELAWPGRNNQRLLDAFAKARSARFEHGECA